MSKRSVRTQALDLHGKEFCRFFVAAFVLQQAIASQTDEAKKKNLEAAREIVRTGHEPYLSGFISLLCVGGPNLAVKLKKGALCRLEV